MPKIRDAGHALFLISGREQIETDHDIDCLVNAARYIDQTLSDRIELLERQLETADNAIIENCRLCKWKKCEICPTFSHLQIAKERCQ